MKQVVVVLDAEQFDAQLLDFAAAIGKNGKTFFRGIFVSKQNLDPVPAIKSLGGQMYVEEITLSPEEKKELDTMHQKNIKLFNNGCASREMISKDCICIDENVFERLIEESRYADLLILPNSLSPEAETDSPTKFVKNILAKSECPVIVSPNSYDQLNNIVFACDGSRHSVSAIKQFYYLFPEFSDRTIHILHIDEDEKVTTRINERLADWIRLRYKHVSFIELHGFPREVLFEYLMVNNMNSAESILISGAFGRSSLSEFFRHSAIETVLKTIDIPVFVSR